MEDRRNVCGFLRISDLYQSLINRQKIWLDFEEVLFINMSFSKKIIWWLGKCQTFPSNSKLEWIWKKYNWVQRGAFCQFPFRWIYYYGSNKSTGNETGKTHLCGVHCSVKRLCVRIIALLKFHAENSKVNFLFLFVIFFFFLAQWLHLIECKNLLLLFQ